jgi:dTDP-4-amino-4,6-dideoxygalactose transaminase
MKILPNIPYLGSEEEVAVREAISSGHLIGNGEICRRVECQMQDIFDVGHVLLSTSCTHALEMAMLALDIGPGDEVILPSFTFASTANCVVLRGAKPVFAEIEPQTLNINPDDVRHRITSRTRAIIPVHYAGVGCNMDEIMAIAEEHGLYVVEDAAQGVDAKYGGRYLGTIGHIGCYSFHSTKNITCGEGGALLTGDDGIARRAEIIREKGTNRSAFLRGEVDKYNWVSVGSSYVLSDLLAAVLEAQLKKRSEIKSRRRAVWEHYHTRLSVLAATGKLVLPTIPVACEPNYHIFFFRVVDRETRAAMLEELRSEGIGATFHYIPLHSSPFGSRQLEKREALPVTDACSLTLVRLPIHPRVTRMEVDLSCDVIARSIGVSAVNQGGSAVREIEPSLVL